MQDAATRLGERKTVGDFERYLRTGRIAPRSPAVEAKFDPYHDPRNGRFTFKPGGSSFSGGAPANRAGSDKPAVSPHDPRHPRNHSIYTVKAGDSLSRIARLRKGVTAADLAWLNGISADAPLRIGQKLMLPNQSYLDAGRDAKNRFLALDFYMQTHGGKLPPDVAHPPSLEQQIGDPAQWHPTVKNGYRFDLDMIERPREIRRGVSIDETAERSRRNQRKAGGSDRRASDDGGHYIAVRFNGPSDAFNHFAQAASFNRGAYRILENVWAASLRGGHRVSVDIVPHYNGLSLRPDRIAVTWFIDEDKHSRTFANESGSNRHDDR